MLFIAGASSPWYTIWATNQYGCTTTLSQTASWGTLADCYGNCTDPRTGKPPICISGTGWNNSLQQFSIIQASVAMDCLGFFVMFAASILYLMYTLVAFGHMSAGSAPALARTFYIMSIGFYLTIAGAILGLLALIIMGAGWKTACANDSGVGVCSNGIGGPGTTVSEPFGSYSNSAFGVSVNAWWGFGSGYWLTLIAVVFAVVAAILMKLSSCPPLEGDGGGGGGGGASVESGAPNTVVVATQSGGQSGGVSCPKCGTPTKPGDGVFCGKCGARVVPEHSE